MDCPVRADSSPAPVWVTDENGEMVFANATYGELVGLPAGDLRSGEPLVIRVRVGEEVHEFEYTVH